MFLLLMVGRGKCGELLTFAMEGSERFAGGGLSLSQNWRSDNLIDVGEADR